MQRREQAKIGTLRLFVKGLEHFSQGGQQSFGQQGLTKVSLAVGGVQPKEAQGNCQVVGQFLSGRIAEGVIGLIELGHKGPAFVAFAK